MSSIWDDDKDVEGQEVDRVKQEQIELSELLDSYIGRKKVYGILEEGYIFTTTFTKSSEGFFNEGKRAAALKWFNEILDLDPSIFAQMCTEFRNKHA